MRGGHFRKKAARDDSAPMECAGRNAGKEPDVRRIPCTDMVRPTGTDRREEQDSARIIPLRALWIRLYTSLSFTILQPSQMYGVYTTQHNGDFPAAMPHVIVIAIIAIPPGMRGILLLTHSRVRMFAHQHDHGHIRRRGIAYPAHGRHIRNGMCSSCFIFAPGTHRRHDRFIM